MAQTPSHATHARVLEIRTYHDYQLQLPSPADSYTQCNHPGFISLQVFEEGQQGQHLHHGYGRTQAMPEVPPDEQDWKSLFSVPGRKRYQAVTIPNQS